MPDNQTPDDQEKPQLSPIKTRLLQINKDMQWLVRESGYSKARLYSFGRAENKNPEMLKKLCKVLLVSEEYLNGRTTEVKPKRERKPETPEEVAKKQQKEEIVNPSHPIEIRLQEIGKTKKWLTEYTSVSMTVLNQYLAGKEIDEEKVERIRKVLQVTPSYLRGIGRKTTPWDEKHLDKPAIREFRRLTHPISVKLKELGWTQAELALKTGLHQSEISAFVTRKRIMYTFDTKAIKIVKALGVDFNYIHKYFPDEEEPASVNKPTKLEPPLPLPEVEPEKKEKVERAEVKPPVLKIEPYPTKVEVITGEYPVIIMELDQDLYAKTFRALVYELSQKCQLDLSQTTIIVHYTSNPHRLSFDFQEWVYFEFDDRSHQAFDFTRLTKNKLDVKIVNALIMNSDKVEIVEFEHKPDGVLLQSARNGWEVYITFNDGRHELEAFFTDRIDREQARNRAMVIAKEYGFETVEE